jgi:hypothetical protein
MYHAGRGNNFVLSALETESGRRVQESLPTHRRPRAAATLAARLATQTAEVDTSSMADFIKVHHQGDDKEVLLNRDHVVSVEDNENGCIVTLSTGATMKLTETSAVLRK